MKKLLLLSMLAFMPMLMLAGVTVYVQSEAAPNLYVWNADGQAINGQWPGTAMSQTVAMDGVTYYAATFEAEKINLILNNAAGQTSDITNIIDDVVLSYSGGSDFSDVTQQVLYGENLSLPEQAAFVTGKQFCYLLTDNLAAPMAYAWNGEGEVTAAFPGDAMTQVADGLFRWEANTAPAQILFNNGSNQVQTADFEFANGAVYAMRYGKVATVTPSDPEGSTTVYVHSDNADANIYVWSNVTGALFAGEWPGRALGDFPVESVDEQAYYKVVIPVAHSAVSLIFNYENSQTEDITGLEADECFFVYPDDGDFTKARPGKYEPTPVDPEGSTTVYVHSDNADANIYAWTTVTGAELAGTYPGTKLNTYDQVEIDGQQYYKVVFGVGAVNMILNVGDGDQNKTEDILGLTGEENFFVYPISDNFTEYTVGKYEPTPVDPEGSTTVYVHSDYADANIYVWSNVTGALFAGEWPGRALGDFPVESVDEQAYYKVVIPVAHSAVSLIFNYVDSQTEDITGLEADDCFFVYPDEGDFTKARPGKYEPVGEPVYLLHYGLNEEGAQWTDATFVDGTGELEGKLVATDVVFEANTEFVINYGDTWYAGITPDDYYLVHSEWCSAIPLASEGGRNFHINEAGTYTFVLTMGDEGITMDVTGWKADGGMGDVTGDGNVDVADVNAVINIMLGRATADDYKGNADLNGDGSVDVADVNKLINLVLTN